MERFGKYILVDKISSGGMADVYRAKVLGIRGFTKTVAIKRIHPHLLERTRFLRMFTDEAKIASRLVHPNIVQIYDLGEADGTPYIAMEYVSARSIDVVPGGWRRESSRRPAPVSNSRTTFDRRTVSRRRSSTAMSARATSSSRTTARSS
jgi:serine/threonine-protein kinase